METGVTLFLEDKFQREENELLRNRLEELEMTMRKIKEEIKQEVTEEVG